MSEPSAVRESSTRIPARTLHAGFVLLALVAVLGTSLQSQKIPIRVAAASDLQNVMPEVVAAFERKTGTHVEALYGSSGNFSNQIQNGAPFDAFFSADSDYPKKLDAEGYAAPNSRVVYGFGRIVLWVPSGSACRPERDMWKCLSDSSVRKIAIANPQHAPYGRAAVAAMRTAGVYDGVKDKIVLGENISQAAQFVQSGNAQAGILAFSLTSSPAMRGGLQWEIPAELYPPIEQSALVLKASRNQAGAAEFLQFVVKGPGRAVLERFGFQPPAAR